jgi:hypothetical protein
MSAVATAGAAAWVVPEILTAKPAAGATLSGTSGTGGTTGGSSGSTANPTTNPGSTTPANLTAATSPAAGSGGSLAMTGLNIQRDAEIGAALIAGGWAMHHWASRAPKPATEAGSPDEPV